MDHIKQWIVHNPCLGQARMDRALTSALLAVDGPSLLRGSGLFLTSFILFKTLSYIWSFKTPTDLCTGSSYSNNARGRSFRSTHEHFACFFKKHFLFIILNDFNDLFYFCFCFKCLNGEWRMFLGSSLKI